MNHIRYKAGCWQLLLLVCLSVAGCGEEKAQSCTASETAPCRCGNGMPGNQFCTSEGVFSDCVCSETNVDNSGGAVTVDSSTAGTTTATGGSEGTTRDAGVTGAAGAAGVAGTVGSAGDAGSPNMVEDGGLTQGDGSVATAGADGAAGNAGDAGSGGTPSNLDLDPFSFFVISYEAIQRLSGSPDGFGGDLRYGEATGIAGADKICSEVAEYSMTGASAKQWRAFLSATTGGPNGGPIHAIERIGTGPWYDRLGRLVAENVDALANTRPEGADSAIVDDLPNEYGIPNHAPDGVIVDNHDMLTGSDSEGRLYGDARSTCQDWMSSVATDGTPRCGHSWPRRGGRGGGIPGRPGGPGIDGMGDMAHWISALNEAGCAPGVNLLETGGPNPMNPTVGSGGGYGGFYCFALTP